MKHFKPCPVTYDKEQFLIMAGGPGNYDVDIFGNEADACHHFAEDRRFGRPVMAFRFNPACPEETRDLTPDFEDAFLASQAYDGFSERNCERDRSALSHTTRGHSYYRDGGV